MGLSERILATEPASLIGYWPMSEASGATATDLSGQGNNGAYTGVTLGQTGPGDDLTCPLFDGTTSFNNIYSVGLAADFNGAEGSVLALFKMANAGVWTDAVSRRAVGIAADDNNLVRLYKAATTGTVVVDYIAGATSTSVASAAQSTLDWLIALVTWSNSGNVLRLYLQGVSVGTPATGLGTWVGSPVSTRTVIGASTTTPSSVHSGWLARPALWSVALTAAQAAYVSNPSPGEGGRPRFGGR